MVDGIDELGQRAFLDRDLLWAMENHRLHGHFDCVWECIEVLQLSKEMIARGS